MTIRRSVLLQLGLLILSGLIAAIYSFQLPGKVATHWDINGQPDGFGSSASILWIGPVLLSLSLLLTIGLPRLPHGRGLAGSNSVFPALMLGLGTFYLFVQIGTLESSRIGTLSQLFVAILPLGIMALGFALPRMEPNPYMGIRTPWTLKNPNVWRNTHRRAGKAWVACGVVGLVLAVARAPFGLVLATILLPIFASLVDSYYLGKHVP
jgi:uncharacterized membrane protein